MILNADRCEALLDRFPAQRILVAGDVMLDRFVYGEVERISPEAPVPVVSVRREKNMAGGAGNVAMNIRALGGTAVMAGYVGKDAAGREVMQVLEEAGVDTAGLVLDEHLRTAVKTRIIAERQQVVRVDWDALNTPAPAEKARFLDNLVRLCADCQGVIIEDYGKGAIEQEAVDGILAAAAAAAIPSGYDPKEGHALRVRGVTLATPNHREALALAGRSARTHDAPPLEDQTLLSAARHLACSWETDMLLVTLGPRGMLLLAAGEARHIPSAAREVFDVSGAGDTVIAAALLALAGGARPEEAAVLANAAAGVVVAKVGTATCSVMELRAALGS